MHTVKISAPLIKPAARLIDQPGRITFPGDPGQRFRLELSPPLIKQHPCTDTGMPLQQTDRLFHLTDEFPFSSPVLSCKKPAVPVPDADPPPGQHCSQISHKPRLIYASAIHHVLPDRHTHTVTVIVPSLRLDLQVFTHHVKPGLFHFPYIKNERIICRSGIQPVRPVSLIEHPLLKLRFPI